jgi:ATPase subunit of ABC transporter with duplicated ATPase domains
MMAKRFASQKENYRLQQEEIERLHQSAASKNEAAERGNNWVGNDSDKLLRGFNRNRSSKSSRTAQTLRKKIDLLEKIEKPPEKDALEIALTANPGTGTLDSRLFDLVAGYEGGFKVGPVALEIRYGERIGIMGLNGSGKSTLLKTITGELPPQSGRLEIGSGVRIGNMMQEHETLPRDHTLLQFMLERALLEQSAAYSKLVKFGFSEKQIRLPIGNLSPGGRARLLLALFSALSVNMLVLDEPTNHLDLEALGALEETLQTYEGTVLLVSHDRYFLEKAALDATYILADGGITKIPDYKIYVKSAEERARKLLRLL